MTEEHDYQIGEVVEFYDPQLTFPCYKVDDDGKLVRKQSGEMVTIAIISGQSIGYKIDHEDAACAHFGKGYNYIPFTCIRKVASTPAACTCSGNQLLWGGCVCGHVNTERK